jgi:putative ABC transport system permease protein
MNIGGRRLKIVGTFDGVTVFAGEPTIVVPIADARAISYASQDLATAVVVRGTPDRVPKGFKVLSNDQAVEDLRRPLEQATGTIAFLNVLLWLIAASIIASLVYLTVLERTRDFAVLKATGVTTRALFASMALQAALMALGAAVVATALSFALSPLLSLRVEISTSTYVLLPVIAVLVGLAASLIGLRKAASIDPALAFG